MSSKKENRRERVVAVYHDVCHGRCKLALCVGVCICVCVCRFSIVWS